MRNGNFVKGDASIPVYSSSYRTYEEWKHNDYKNILWTRLVLTVPMRNGNIPLIFIFNNSSEFLPYLWGMETRESPSGKRKGLEVLTVPMRNGNALCQGPLATLYRVLTVPMRNGNLLVLRFSLRFSLRSYRTYEEWKPSLITSILCGGFRSYRTYEEWKQSFFIYFIIYIIGSYRTYEEWKLLTF